MQHAIIKYPVKHPLLKGYIKFFWSLKADYLEIDHKLIPQRNINMRFNLSETPQFLSINGKHHLLENAYFSGLQDHFTNYHLKHSGKADMLGICFYPDGFYPFLNTPVSEFKNQFLGASEAGFKPAAAIIRQLEDAPDMISRLSILEGELILVLKNSRQLPEQFRQIFHTIGYRYSPIQITGFCHCRNISVRKLERMFNKYVGLPASTFSTINRFHNSINHILSDEYSKLSDLAYDNGYFDQMHFIRDFKRFTGNTPKDFIQQKRSILQIGKTD